MANLVAVIGSTTPPGRLSRAVLEALARSAEAGHSTASIDLGTVKLGFADGRPPADRDDDSESVISQLAGADAVLFASPVYRASFTGALKNLLDLVPLEVLKDKPCGIVAMGATTHHFLGVEWHLRDVLGWFGALVAPTAVYLSNSDFEQGAPGARAVEQLDALLATLARLSEALGDGGGFGPLPLAAGKG